jgi:hypothetical protein
LIHEAIHRCRLDLSGLTVLTEAASGAYVVTPILAAAAGADVYALAASTTYGSSEELQELTSDLARLGGVTDRVRLIVRKERDILGAADVVTNSGQVRPIDAGMIAHMKRSAVVPLMYESWEYRQTDVDLDACRERGILVAGTNERHPDVDVFSFLGQMAVKQFHDAGVAVRGSHVLVLCDNAFGSFIAEGLKSSGAIITLAGQLTAGSFLDNCDAVMVAMQPQDRPVLTADEAQLLSHAAPGAVLIQYWGDVDRSALAAARVPVWPPQAPGRGHMGILPSAVGPEPIVRLQAGGLKVGEVLARGLGEASADDLAFVQLLELGAH